VDRPGVRTAGFRPVQPADAETSSLHW